MEEKDKGVVTLGNGEKVLHLTLKKKWFADTPSTNSEENRTIRSKTFPGIAKAMADQWGNI